MVKRTQIICWQQFLRWVLKEKFANHEKWVKARLCAPVGKKAFVLHAV